MPAQMLDSPPPLPQDVKSSMGGGSPFAGVGEMLAAKKPGMDGMAAKGPQGALNAQADAVTKVLQQMVTSSNAGKTFFSRAIKMIEQGVAAESQQGPGAPAKGDMSMQMTGPDMAGPGSGMSPPPPFPG